MSSDDFRIRRIETRDDPAMAAVIRSVMTELGASGPGFAIHDPEVDGMSAAYGRPRHDYFVLVRGDEVQGGAGYGQLTGADESVCELRKMYFYPHVRGAGLGARMLEHVLAEARGAGYTTCYLETLQSMTAARKLYEASGFAPIGGPMGCTGHFACDAWYAKSL
ncbi:MAG TPA: GNAT family N-acetyltransferase [Kofleriaceae bacterium]|nr:GNAT family N-acetyltransferase [Kofleriaceae bacterium]